MLRHPARCFLLRVSRPLADSTYATPSQRYAYETPALYFSPRVGFAYAPDTFHGTLAFRGGFGIYFNPYNDYNAPQAYGFSATTNYLSNSTNQTNQVPVSNLSDPFNSGVNPLQQPVGSSQGVNTNLGSSAIFFAQLHVPYTEKVSLDVQKQFGRSWMVEVSGFSSHSVHLSSSFNVSAVPMLPLLSRQADDRHSAYDRVECAGYESVQGTLSCRQQPRTAS